MIAKSISATTLLISGIAFIVLGICLFFVKQLTLQVLLFILGILMSIFGGSSLLRFFFEKQSTRNQKISLFTIGIRDFIIGLFILTIPNLILHSLAICFGIYLLLHTAICCIEYFLYRKNYLKGRLKVIINILFQLFFLIPLLFNREENIQVTSIILGIYLIGYGITKITDFLTILVPKRTTERIKQQIQIPLPVIINAFIPRKLITLVNEMLAIDTDSKQFNSVKQSASPDIYVLIHLASSGTAAMGHMEIAFENQIYSYGNYDLHSRSLFNAIGDGVILVASKQDYIRYVVTKKNRYVVEFGLSLTKKEIEVVKKQLHKLVYTNTEPYYSDLELSDKGLLPDSDYQDMSSEIYKYAKGKFYKITKGKYKKFFVLKTNCAMVAQYVLSSIGKQILCINGIITPGAYYDYLNERFKLKNTNVVSRKVYTKKDFKEKQE